MKKVAIVINGGGGVGKDTLCDLASKHFKVINISTITPIKELARMAGWNGEKTDKARKYLADLKALCVEYNDFPTEWALSRYREFLDSDADILFVHIREPREIEKFVRATDGEAKTLLVRAKERLQRASYGNDADDCVENYEYDYYFSNDGTLAEAEEGFKALLKNVLE
jgi:guanylate kinase